PWGVRPGMSPAALAGWWGRAMPPVLAVACVLLAVHLATNATYGLHTDELYYILCGQHPALGYVDFPPATPLLARLDTTIFGIHPWTLRLIPAIPGAGVVVIAGMYAREMGGGRRAAILSSVVVAMSPLLVATYLFQTVEFDLLAWAIAIYLVLRILRTGDPRLFMLLGLDLGVGIETKLTILGLCVGFAVAVLASPELRRHLRTRCPWFGLAIALGLAAPNLGWQVANSFPTLTYVRNHSGDIASSGALRRLWSSSSSPPGRSCFRSGSLEWSSSFETGNFARRAWSPWWRFCCSCPMARATARRQRSHWSSLPDASP
ncbi:MAG: glycosyltransferase family 39 protein, partial [Candidatus Dormibacterales bacterium]